MNFCDEVLVIDDYSKDDTARIVKSFGAKVFQRKLNSDFSSQRNYGLEKAKGDWVLFVDADEIVPIPPKYRIHDMVFLERWGNRIKDIDWYVHDYSVTINKAAKNGLDHVAEHGKKLAKKVSDVGKDILKKAKDRQSP